MTFRTKRNYILINLSWNSKIKGTKQRIGRIVGEPRSSTLEYQPKRLDNWRKSGELPPFEGSVPIVRPRKREDWRSRILEYIPLDITIMNCNFKCLMDSNLYIHHKRAITDNNNCIKFMQISTNRCRNRKPIQPWLQVWIRWQLSGS